MEEPVRGTAGGDIFSGLIMIGRSGAGPTAAPSQQKITSHACFVSEALTGAYVVPSIG